MPSHLLFSERLQFNQLQGSESEALLSKREKSIHLTDRAAEYFFDLRSFGHRLFSGTLGGCRNKTSVIDVRSILILDAISFVSFVGRFHPFAERKNNIKTKVLFSSIKSVITELHP